MSQLDFNADQIANLIAHGDWKTNSLEKFVNAIKYRRSQITFNVPRTLAVGDTVRFTNSKYGRIMQGTVEKIAIKYVNIRCSGQLWRVPASMLELV